MSVQKIVPFKFNAGITSDLTKKLLEKGKSYGLKKIVPLSTEKIVVAEWVDLKCKYGCKRYNTSWCCPPNTPDPDKVRSILSQYSSALLLVGETKYENFYRDNDRKRIIQIQSWKSTLIIERLLFLEGYYKAFSLVSEYCPLCRDCAYPDNCRFPQEKRPSLESFSIDILSTLNNVNIVTNVARNKCDEYNRYSLILLE